MIIIRPISQKDQDVFVEYSFNSTLGIRNLPRGKEKLHDKIIQSEQSFLKDVHKPSNEQYFFVLEDLSTGKIGGTCGIIASFNPSNSLNFKVHNVKHHTKNKHIIQDIPLLKLTAPIKEASEICSLYLHPSYRHSGLGRLLALSRFLFIASHPYRFKKKIIAEMRGFINENLISPFWESVGRHFCNLSFVELMSCIDQGTIEIHDIFPKHPIYLSLLPPEAQNAIGKTHESTKPAVLMLQNEGFKVINEVDALEGGPNLIAPITRIRSITKSKVVQIDITNDLFEEKNDFLLSNTRMDFRACCGHIEVLSKTKGLITADVAEALHLKKGDMIRYVSAH
ncbi:MAG: arginine N-succinyltransferase [Parachlamydiaceae bacterium]|nr:arginine N-succinyltransferase [Parachlamydiaceae bacterium]